MRGEIEKKKETRCYTYFHRLRPLITRKPNRTSPGDLSFLDALRLVVDIKERNAGRFMRLDYAYHTSEVNRDSDCSDRISAGH